MLEQIEMSFTFNSYAPHINESGAYCFTIVRPSVCLSVELSASAEIIP